MFCLDTRLFSFFFFFFFFFFAITLHFGIVLIVTMSGIVLSSRGVDNSTRDGDGCGGGWCGGWSLAHEWLDLRHGHRIRIIRPDESHTKSEYGMADWPLHHQHHTLHLLGTYLPLSHPPLVLSCFNITHHPWFIRNCCLDYSRDYYSTCPHGTHYAWMVCLHTVVVRIHTIPTLSLYLSIHLHPGYVLYVPISPLATIIFLGQDPLASFPFLLLLLLMFGWIKRWLVLYQNMV